AQEGVAPATATATATATPRPPLSAPAAVVAAQGTAGFTRGQTSAPCAASVGQTCTVAGGVTGTGTKNGSMAWTLNATAPMPAGPPPPPLLPPPPPPFLSAAPPAGAPEVPVIPEAAPVWLVLGGVLGLFGVTCWRHRRARRE